MRGLNLLLPSGVVLATSALAGAAMTSGIRAAGFAEPLAGQAPPHFIFDDVTLLGIFVAGFTLLCYSHEKYRPNLPLGSAIGGLLVIVYAALAAAWPLCVIGLLWSLASVKRWRSRPIRRAGRALSHRRHFFHPEFSRESRISRMFGPMN